MAHYQGSNAEGAKARSLQSEREAAAERFRKLQEEIRQANQVKLHDMNESFQSRQSAMDELFKAQTVGLVSASDFKRKRLELEKAEQEAAEAARRKVEKEKKKKGKLRKEKMKALSFDVDELEEGTADTADTSVEESKDGNGSSSSSSNGESASVSPATATAASSSSSSSSSSSLPPSKRARLSTKDPNADTSFLPDKQREAEEAALRERLAKEWSEKQEKVKQEKIEVVYSYWDGSGHRFKLQIHKGATIGQFLERARRDIVEQFHELKAIGSEGLMYVKEDLIIPQHYTFYDLIVTKARGKSGPLFHFDVHDDVRMSIDASVEKDESHAGKIVTKTYYERNKTNFPASRWEPYDPAVQREKYTIKGGEVHGAYAKK